MACPVHPWFTAFKVQPLKSLFIREKKDNKEEGTDERGSKRGEREEKVGEV